MEKVISPITGKSKYLLIENCEVISDIKISQDLKESLKLSAGKNGTLIVRNLPGTILNRENQNGRIYSTQVLMQAIKEAKPLFETKQLLSQACEHPEGSFVSPTTASHVVTNAYVKQNVRVTVDGETGNYDMLFMDIEVLNTEEGKNLRALLEAECSVGTSIRGVGDMEGKYVKNYEILGIDFVGNPSSSTYTRMPVSESVKVEAKDSRSLQEKFTVTTTSTDVVRDLEQAAVLQSKLKNIGYATVTKTSTKVDEETDEKTGAQTSITTLEAETSDDVSDLDQALQLAKNAMINGTVHVDSVTIENIPEENTNESVEEGIKLSNSKDSDYVPEAELNEKEETPMTEAKEEKEDPNTGKKFVLHTGRGFVTFDKNAIDFTDDPKEALHFTQGKEENGMVSMSKVTEILDAMGIFEVEKYFQKGTVNLGGEEEQTPKKEGLMGGIAGGIIGKQIGSGYPIAGAALGSIAQDAITKDESAINEENGNNTKYRADVVITDGNGNKTESITVSAIDLEGAQKEIANLWDMKMQSISGDGNVDITLIDTQTGEQKRFNPESRLLENSKDSSDTTITEDSDDIKVDGNKVITKLDNNTTIEKDFDSPLQAQLATTAVAQGKAAPKVLVPEAEEEMITCAWCKDKQDKIDCKKEKDLGWLCPQCERSLESQGVELEFEENSIDEKLYSNPSEPSDGYAKEPIEENSEDLLVTLKNIDWDIEKIIADLNPDEDAEEAISKLEDPCTIRLNSVELDTDDIKGAILKAANEQTPWVIKNATIDKIEDAKLGGVYYDANKEDVPDNLISKICNRVYTELKDDNSEQANLILGVMNSLYDWQDVVRATEQQFATALMYVLQGLHLSPEYKDIYDIVEQIADNAPNAVFAPAPTSYEKDSSI